MMPRAAPITCLVTSGEATPENFDAHLERILVTVELAVKTSISMIQVREKRLTELQLFHLASAAAGKTRGSQTKLLVNDRADIALASGADGVHLPESGVPVAVVRKVFPPPFVIGSSVHTIDAAENASRDGADFLLFGPVFDSGEKHGVGLAQLSRVVSAAGDTRVLAVGGIDGSNIDDVIKTGASGYASIRYLNDHAVLKGLRY